MPDDDPSRVLVSLPGWFALSGRLVAALERLAGVTGEPGLAAGPLLLVPKGSTLEWAMSSIPNDRDAIQHLAPGDYDGPVTAEVVDTGSLDGVSVTPETPDGLAQRVSAPVGTLGSVVVEYTADKRHGGDVATTSITVGYDFVARDAPNLQTRDVELVDKVAPAGG